jgi:hypothetical protein
MEQGRVMSDYPLTWVSIAMVELLQTLAAYRATTRLIVLEATGGYQALAAKR